MIVKVFCFRSNSVVVGRPRNKWNLYNVRLMTAAGPEECAECLGTYLKNAAIDFHRKTENHTGNMNFSVLPMLAIPESPKKAMGKVDDDAHRFIL